MEDENFNEEDSSHDSHYCTVLNIESIDSLCDRKYHDDEMIWHDLLNCLLVREDQIVHVLMRENGAHRFIEYIMWNT